MEPWLHSMNSIKIKAQSFDASDPNDIKVCLFVYVLCCFLFFCVIILIGYIVILFI